MRMCFTQEFNKQLHVIETLPSLSSFSVLLVQIVDNINASEYMINKESLLPGNHYQARVRARGPVGLWSDWSPLVSWKTHDGVIFVYLFMFVNYLIYIDIPYYTANTCFNEVNGLLQMESLTCSV